jgi:hypothetical protein
MRRSDKEQPRCQTQLHVFTGTQPPDRPATGHLSEIRPDTGQAPAKPHLSSTLCKPLRNFDAIGSHGVPLASAGSRMGWRKFGEGSERRIVLRDSGFD